MGTKNPESRKPVSPESKRVPSIELKYRSGEAIKKGDRVFFYRNLATVEFVACDSSDPEMAWFMEEYGGGVMILDPAVSGRTFIDADQIDEEEELEFVSRA